MQHALPSLKTRKISNSLLVGFIFCYKKLRTHPMTVYLFRPEISKPTQNLTDRNLNKLPY